jgi:hypothetical protein
MSDDRLTLEERVEKIARELQLLTAKVDRLAFRIDSSSPSSEFVQGRETVASTEARSPLPPQSDWTGATILAGTAAVCFLLVVALTLRTLVDNRIIDQPIGAIAGLAYASLILVYGYYRARSKRKFASLSTTCGVTLVLAIVLETHFRFDLLPAEAAYGILAATLFVMLVAGLRYCAYGPLDIAIPGISLVAMSMNFPNPDFVHLGCVLALGIIAAYAVTSDPRTRWLVWCMLALTAFFWIWWALKLRIPLLRHEELLPSLRENWYLPSLSLFVLLYVFQTSHTALSAKRPLGAFECIVPSVTGLGAYAAARAIAVAEGYALDTLGWAGIGAALIYVAIAAWFAHRNDKARRAATWFAVASLALLALIVPETTPNAILTLVVWSLAAVAVSLFGRGRLGPAVQIAAILLQIYGCAFGAWHGIFGVNVALPAAAAMAVLFVACAYHYGFVQRGPDASKDRSAALPQTIRPVAIAVFFVSVIYAFGAARLTLYTLLASALDDVWHYFECGQSMLINVGALLLAVLALKWKRNDFMATAVLVAILGALKVLTYDLLRTQGIPLVLSVFVFGVTTTAGSLIWNRWQRSVSPEDPNTTQS